MKITVKTAVKVLTVSGLTLATGLYTNSKVQWLPAVHDLNQAQWARNAEPWSYAWILMHLLSGAIVLISAVVLGLLLLAVLSAVCVYVNKQAKQVMDWIKRSRKLQWQQKGLRKQLLSQRGAP